MNRSTAFCARVLLLALAGAGAFLIAPKAEASSRVGVNVSVGVPIPHGYAHVRVGRDDYWYRGGNYYRPGRYGRPVWVHAPRGAYVRHLPPSYSRYWHGNRVYYRYRDDFYQPYGDGYVVVEPPPTVVRQVTRIEAAPPETHEPMGASSNAIGSQGAPEETHVVWVGDVAYEYKDGEFFKRSPEGLVWSEPPVGAVAKSLPADARTVWHEDIEYFESKGVYFRKTPDGYKVVNKPWQR